MRAGLVALVAVVIVVLAVGGLFLASGGAFSRARHEWKVEVFAPPGASWAVEAPRLVLGMGAAPDDHEALESLLGELALVKGEAAFELRDLSLYLAGRGDATVLATRSFYAGGRESFLDWSATGTNVTRRDEGSANVQVTWSVHFSGGTGHTCWGSDSHTVFLTPGETEEFTFPSNAQPYEGGQLWNVVCA